MGDRPGTSSRRRRGHNEGSIFQRKDGRWVARVDLGYQNGRRQRKDMFGRTRRDVQQKLAAAQRAVQDNLPIPAERQRFGAFLTAWLEDVARPNLRPRVFVRYRELLTLHAIPTLGARPLAKVTPQDMQALYRVKLEEGLAPRTVGHLHRVLHRALADALRWGLVARNVCDAVKPPKVQAQEMRALSPNEARQLLTAAAGDPLQALYVVAVTVGLRQGELLGLKWADVDLDAGRLQVRRSIARVNGQGWIEQEPKSAKSRRSVALTRLAVESLYRHRRRQLERRVKALAWEDNGFVFANEVGRPLTPQNLTQRSFLPLLERAGLPRVRFHDLRHTAATLLLAQGVHPKVVQEMLGHSTVSLTLDVYSHVTPTLQSEAAEKMQAVLAGGVV